MPELRELIRSLEQIVGEAHLATGAETTRRYAVDGQSPALVVTPADAAQVAAVLSAAVRLGAVVIPWGGGTAMGRGHAAEAYDVALSLSALDRVVEFDVANLTVTVQSGLTLSRLQAALAEERQFLPLDPPLPDVATVGGVVASNTNGPSRLRYGSVRDLVLGMRAALTTGDVVHVGGKTVKNVAGYDLGKLFIGSYGTLGVITEVTFRLLPWPALKKALWIGHEDRSAAYRLATQILDSVLLPAYLTVLNGPAIRRIRPDSAQPFALVVGFDGSPETVARQVCDVTQMAGAAELLEAERLAPVRDSIRDFARGQRWTGSGLGATVAVPTSATEACSAEIEQSAAAASVSISSVASVPAGTISFVLESDRTDSLVAVFARAVDISDRLSGHCVLDWAEPRIKEQVQPWGTPQSAWRLFRAVKQKFDPAGTLNRGRFVGAI